MQGIAKRVRASAVQSDEVALKPVVYRRRVDKLHTPRLVAGDQIARARFTPADQDLRGGNGDSRRIRPGLAVPQGQTSSGPCQ